jgi:hypothetical protein
MKAVVREPFMRLLKILKVFGVFCDGCRDTRALLASGNEADAQAFIADNPHKRLWQLLAEHALQNLELAVAEKAFVHCADYQGVQLVKRLAQLGDKAKQQAEVRHPLRSAVRALGAETVQSRVCCAGAWNAWLCWCICSVAELKPACNAR